MSNYFKIPKDSIDKIYEFTYIERLKSQMCKNYLNNMYEKFIERNDYNMKTLKEQIEETTKELEKLHIKLDKLREDFAKEDTYDSNWKPEENEIFYYIDMNGDIEWTYYYDDEYDNTIISNNKIFKTEEECQRYKNYLDAIKKYTYKFTKEEWEDSSIEKHCIKYWNGEFDVDCWSSTNEFNKFTFKTKLQAFVFLHKYKDDILRYEF